MSLISSALSMVQRPRIATAAIGDLKFDVIGAHFGVQTQSNGYPGVPNLPSIGTSIVVLVNLNDQLNLPFAALRQLYAWSCDVSKEKIKDMVLTFWSDDSADNVICRYTFRGWISSYSTTSGESRGATGGTGGVSSGLNHLLTLAIQPELDSNAFLKVELGN